MAHRPTINESYSDLWPLIEKHLVRRQFTKNNGKDFLPLDSFELLFSKDNIQKDLPSASDDLVDFVHKKARRTFATVLCTLVGHSKDSITSVMKSFQTHGFDDNCLPIKEQLKACPNDYSEIYALSLAVFDAPLMRQCFNRFSTYQWVFLVPKFPLEKGSRELDRNCILPFTESGEDKKEGTFGEVTRFKLRVDHQELIPQPQEGNESLEIYVAVKKFKQREKVSLNDSVIWDVKSAWSREADILEEFTTTNFPRTCIAGAIGSFSSNEDYYIIMPWAAGGTLREFWDRNHRPDLYGDLINEILHQYMNLVASLCDLHRHRYPEEGLEDKNLDDGPKDISFAVSQGAQNAIPDAQEVYNDTTSEGSNWRHGDLKPENILRKEEGNVLGPLMIGDVGLAKKHKNRTLVRADTDTRLGTMNHEPPEAFFNTEWDFVNDNTFAPAIAKKLGQSIMSPGTSTGQYPLCRSCSEFDFWAKDFVIQDKLSDSMENPSCGFCKLRHQACRGILDTAGPEGFRFNISLASSALTLSDRPAPCHMDEHQDRWNHMMSRCWNSASPQLHSKVPEIQIGIPELPRGEARFEICRQWLQDCDTHNSCKLIDRFKLAAKGPPTRLLYVGKDNAPQLRLYEPGKEEVNLKYLALSHPWGDKSLHSHFFTDIHNFDKHKKCISETDLPHLFKDAIKLTRALHCEYIWIDSLCIIQGQGGDFESEASRMELVYSMAYCVIATTHANGNSDNFLIPGLKRDYIKINNSGTRFYVCEPIDDFQKHVLDGHLNTRGWVLQERALARRTIHFTEKQMYWECGEGIRCETMTKMKNEQAAFLGDPNFPLRAMQSTKGTKTLFYQILYMQYSRLKFSQITDRRLGIAGLEQRLIKDFKVDGGFGIFQAPPERIKDHGYFGRSLLWKRGQDVPELTMIDYSKARPPALVPSWSWMAYKEGIDYVEDPILPFNEVVWETKEINSPWNVTHSSQSWHTGIRGKSTALRGTARSFFCDSAVDGKDIWYDRKLRCCSWDSGKSHVMCVRIGSAKKVVASLPVETSYVLLVHPKPGTKVYERVGVAALSASWIKKDREISVQIA
ncbi:hypothetical protein GQX73_g9293 [Xylaria multiplex]|uniref:Protein kinase domain-containing protein n=1 Tax=Xylaria multiplex TaxID=323545 RepID=A0A7C8IN14_9PEZI|nr:hypothetical protein GQX73_g9293 [Xylaria multiplex]